MVEIFDGFTDSFPEGVITEDAALWHEHAGKFYYPDTISVCSFDPCHVMPQLKDFNDQDWMDLINYYNSNRYLDYAVELNPKDFDNFETMRAPTVEICDPETVRLSGNQGFAEFIVHAAYLEGLCRLRKLEIVGQILESLKGHTFIFAKTSGPINSLLLSFDTFSLLDVMDGFKFAILAPIISDEELIEFEASLIAFRKLSWDQADVLRKKITYSAIECRRTKFLSHLLAEIEECYQRNGYSPEFKSLFGHDAEKYAYFNYFVNISGCNPNDLELFKVMISFFDKEEARMICESVICRGHTATNQKGVSLCTEHLKLLN